MNNKPILLIEDNPDDEALTLRALKKNNISNEVIVAHDGAAANLQTISQGGAQAADVALPPPGYQGWLLMDSLGRGMLGLPATNEVIVQRLIDKTNVSTSINALFPDYANYQQDFEKLWGLS